MSNTLWAINKGVYEELLKSMSIIESVNKSKCLCARLKQEHQEWIAPDKKSLLPQFKEFIGYNQINHKPILEQKWTFVFEFTREKNGKTEKVRSYYTPSEHGQSYQTYNPESDDDKHKVAQSILLTEFLEGDLQLDYYGISIPLNCIKYKQKKDVEEYCEQIENFKDLFDRKVNHTESRRADMLIEFENFNEKFGWGIAFEIHNTEGLKSISEKSNDWTNGGYSYVAMDINDFNLDGDKIKNNRLIKVDAPFDRWKQIEINTIKEYYINNKKQVIEYERLLTNISETDKKFIDDVNESVNKFKEECRKDLEDFKVLKKNQIDVLETEIQFKNRFLDDIEQNRDILIKSIITNLDSDIKEKTTKIMREIECSLYENNDKIKQIEELKDILNQSDDFKCKIDKTIFNSCEDNRKFCINIIKKKLDEYYDILRKKLKDGIDKDIEGMRKQ